MTNNPIPDFITYLDKFPDSKHAPIVYWQQYANHNFLLPSGDPEKTALDMENYSYDARSIRALEYTLENTKNLDEDETNVLYDVIIYLVNRSVLSENSGEYLRRVYENSVKTKEVDIATIKKLQSLFSSHVVNFYSCKNDNFDVIDRLLKVNNSVDHLVIFNNVIPDQTKYFNYALACCFRPDIVKNSVDLHAQHYITKIKQTIPKLNSLDTFKNIDNLENFLASTWYILDYCTHNYFDVDEFEITVEDTSSIEQLKKRTVGSAKEDLEQIFIKHYPETFKHLNVLNTFDVQHTPMAIKAALLQERMPTSSLSLPELD